ncbi:MAG: extracellular matrix regulatory protein [Clostridiales bacterium]|nr:extracellular matrix regulatory protein [Clostridiales bacterium]
MGQFINIGFGNVVNTDKIIAIIRPEAAPIKRMIQNSKDNGVAVDATCGRKTKAVLVMESGQVVLSALLPETIAGRTNEGKIIESRIKGEDNE